MGLDSGTTLLHYRVAEKIGEGGMGVVWKARDTTLDRDVAIKILPGEVQQEPERLARFEREAKLLASLNHPNIASIYGLHEAETPTGALRFIVMELVPGQDLAERLARGALPVRDALEIARQVAEALETAHDQGVIHRDLKPANIKLGHDNQVKVLDFGLAKAFEPEPGASEAGPSLSPTLTTGGTRAGVIIGTAAYMSPEQARGHAVDKRADIWSFGAVLYELLTGRQVFGGETISDSLASVLKVEPDWSLLPADTPEPVRRLLARCLEKRPKQRLRDIGEARIRVEEALGRSESAVGMPAGSSGVTSGITAERASEAGTAAVSTAGDTAEVPSGGRSILPWAVAGVALVAAVTAFLVPRGPETAPRPVMRVEMVLSEDGLRRAPFATTVLSPDGTRIAYISDGDNRLYVRLADQLEGAPLSGTDGALQPFFSPDGEWIAFFAERKLKKVSVFGGAPLTLCEVENLRGGTWGPDDTIVFAPDSTKGLFRVSATGGKPEELTVPDKTKGEASHRWPHFLPGGRAVLFTVEELNTNFDEARIEVLELDSMKRTVLHHGGSYPSFIPTGHLVYVHDATLFAARFDLRRLELLGAPVPVVENVRYSSGFGVAHYHASASGHLLYRSGSSADRNRTLSWIDLEGNRVQALTEPRDYRDLSVSPDGNRLLMRLSGDSANSDLWIHDFERGTMSRLTFSDSSDGSGSWTPDGERVLFSSDRHGGKANVYRKRADGTGDAERLTESENWQGATVTTDGKWLVISERFPETGWDVMLAPVDGDGEPRVYLRTPFTEGWPRVSPDGRWLTYGSNESGQWEIYVRPFPEGQGKWQVSTDGAQGPAQWSADGRELFYRKDDDLMAVDVAAQGTRFVAGRPRVLLEQFGGRRWGISWAVHPDGRRFLVTDRDDEDAENDDTRVTLVVNWFDELRLRVPERR